VTERATTIERASKPSLLAGYVPSPEIFDELLQPDGQVREHYRKLLEALESFGKTELKARRDAGNRLLHEQGVTYNVYADPQGLERPWQLDPIPLVISAEEWRSLEAGLVQRATLLNQILADCYGPQELIRSGRLPPALVFAQPEFLRPCHGIRPAQDTFLHLYGADIARSPDGRWWVISDRTQIPTGAGYALENRLVTARILHEPFREGHVQRLAGFFRRLQASLAASTAGRTENPRVVLLTPGPYNETYFEQAYLARYLGYTLVEGQDLVARDSRLFLKTLSGLEPVDVILRRVDDEFCDPLELRNDSMLGAPGMVEAVRAGHLVIANALGSSLVQSPAFMAFLPGLCEHLLGEELKLPSVATWWCGQAPARAYVREHLEGLLVRPAFGPEATQPLAGARKKQATDQETVRRMEFQPHLFVGQERVVFSTAPAWSEQGLLAGQISVRVYLVAEKGTYRAMPGGLARVATGGTTPQISMQRGGASKDVWVLSEKPVEDVTLLHQANHALELRRVGNNLPSRAADNFFWLGRYAERAEAAARLLRSTMRRFNVESEGAASPLLLPLLQTLLHQGQLALLPDEGDSQDSETLEAELLAALFDQTRPGSLWCVLDRLQQITGLMRDRLSSDTWRVVNHLKGHLTSSPSDASLLSDEALAILNQIILSLAAFDGLAMENMTRAQGWRFLDMGHRIERSLYLCTLLGCALRSPVATNPSLLEALLEIADSSLTYRSRYTLLPRIAAVYDLLLLDDTNPRSLIFQLNQLAQHFEYLPREKATALPSPGQRILIESLAKLRLADPMELGKEGTATQDSEMAGVIDTIATAMPRLSDAIAVGHFTHSAVTRAEARSAVVPAVVSEWLPAGNQP
jgi:uncharacterized circularly permuted ATP-grasp superfamily protein/uncharacterized alpha-E superfamily protein